MVGEQAALVTAHTKMINKDRTGGGRFRGGVKGAFEGSEDVGDVFVEVTYFARCFSDELRLIGG